METEVAKMDDKTEVEDLPGDETLNSEVPIAEESAMSHDSEYDDFLGVPESLNITVNENGEPVNVEEIQDDTCDLCEYYISNFDKR